MRHGIGRARARLGISVDAPPPKAGDVISTPIPDDFDGIRFEVSRMVEYVRAAKRDPLVVDTARYIAERSAAASDQMGSPVVAMSDSERKLLFVEGIVYWCQENYFYVCDPAGIELMQTSGRMIRQQRTPRELLEVFFNPIMNRMAQARGVDPSGIHMPDGRAIGDCEEGVVLSLSLCVALDIVPVRFEFGGNDGTLHHVWSGVHTGEAWHQFDVTQPTLGVDQVLPFENYDTLDFEA